MATKPTALITGITGQDGAYLAQHLIGQGYRVIGGRRRTASGDLWRLQELGISDKVDFVEMEMTEATNITRTVKAVNPDEIYNLAAQSFVGSSFEAPCYTGQTNGLGVAYLLEAIREYAPHARFYQASTSEMFGRVQAIPQNETTPFYPRSPYGVAKLYAHWLAINYRESYGLHAACGILFNHESPLRGNEFVTRKITRGLARLAAEGKGVLELGNLAAKRDWGYAPEYVQAMQQMAQAKEPDTFVLATGATATIEEFVNWSAEALDILLEWEGEGIKRRAIWNGNVVVRVNPDYYRPAEVDLLLGDPSKAKEKLGWEATTKAQALAGIMARADLAKVIGSD